MPVMLGTTAAAHYLTTPELPTDLFQPYPADEMVAWRVSDDAKSSRVREHAGMVEPVEQLL